MLGQNDSIAIDVRTDPFDAFQNDVVGIQEHDVAVPAHALDQQGTGALFGMLEAQAQDTLEGWLFNCHQSGASHPFAQQEPQGRGHVQPTTQPAPYQMHTRQSWISAHQHVAALPQGINLHAEAEGIDGQYFLDPPPKGAGPEFIGHCCYGQRIYVHESSSEMASFVVVASTTPGVLKPALQTMPSFSFMGSTRGMVSISAGYQSRLSFLSNRYRESAPRIRIRLNLKMSSVVCISSCSVVTALQKFAERNTWVAKSS